MTANQRFGWIMFVLSGVAFLVVAIRTEDWWTGAGAVIWIIGCLSFLTDRGG